MEPQNGHPLPQLPPVPQHFPQLGQQQQTPPTAYQQYGSQQFPAYQQSPADYPSQQAQPAQSPYQQQQPRYPQPPLPPQHQQQSRPPLPESRKSRSFSFRSDKSHKSNDIVETHAEKEAKRLHSKADPTLAMNEAEPGVVAATVKSSLASLRSMTHRDASGNTIQDPDRSNPTRSRWERPLDTIRSFEAAIDGDRGYNRRSMMPSDADPVANWNKRSSFYAASTNGNGGRYPYPRDSYYGDRRPPSMMPQPDNRFGGQDSYYDHQGPPGNNAYSATGPRQRYPRMASEPQFYTPRQAEPVYPMPMNHRSYETVASGSGSGSSGEAAGYQTDPTSSSENSSLDRIAQGPPKPPTNDYGIGFAQNQAANYSLGFSGSNGGPQNQQSFEGASPEPPAVPRKENMILRKPTRTPTALPVSLATGGSPPERPGMGEKRKSWLARRFSKKA